LVHRDAEPEVITMANSRKYFRKTLTTIGEVLLIESSD